MQHPPSLPVAYSMPYFSPPNAGEYPSIMENGQPDPNIYYAPNPIPNTVSSDFTEHAPPRPVAHLTFTAPAQKAKALTARELVLLLSTIGIGSAAGLAYLLKDPKKVSLYFNKLLDREKLAAKTPALTLEDLKKVKNKNSPSNRKNSSIIWKGLGSVFGGGLGLKGLYHFALHKDAIQNRENVWEFGRHKLFGSPPNKAEEKGKGSLPDPGKEDSVWGKTPQPSPPASPKIDPQNGSKSPRRNSFGLDSPKPTRTFTIPSNWDENPWNEEK